MSGFFTRLARYRGGPGRESIEDFFTEVVAELLRSEPAVLRETLRVLVPKEADGLRLEGVDITTQHIEAGGGLRFDLVIRLPGQLTILLENKIASPIGREQLLRYLEFARKSRTTKLAAVVREPEDLDLRDALFLGRFFWADLSQVWSRISDIKNENRYLMDQVQIFMKELNMGATEPFRADEMKAAHLWFPFEQKMTALVGKLDRSLPPLEDREAFKRTVGPIKPCQPGFHGVLYSSPKGEAPGDAVFWYLCGFVYPPYHRWFRTPDCSPEPECTACIALWSGMAVDDLQARVAECLDPSVKECFQVTLSDDGRGVIVHRSRPLATFLEASDQADQIYGFLKESHGILTASGQVQRLYQMLRRQSEDSGQEARGAPAL